MASDLKAYLSRPEKTLPPQWSLDEAIEEILRLHSATDGTTFSLYFGNQAGERLYSVSVFPDRSYALDGKQITREELRAFLQQNSDLLSDPRCCVGTWYSRETDQTYIDVSVILPNKRETLSLGNRYNQEGVFDLFRMEFLPTGGTGEAPETLPPETERLPELIRRKRRL